MTLAHTTVETSAGAVLLPDSAVLAATVGSACEWLGG